MSLSTGVRAGLADRQIALVSALVAGGEMPEGFDAARLQAAAAALERKRAMATARAWPKLAQALGQRFRDRFADYARTTPLPSKGGPLLDGRTFARWLAARGELPEASRLQALGVDLRYTVSPKGLFPRRGPALKAAFLNRPWRLVVAVRLPWLGEHWLSIPLGMRQHE
jgi:hypothetical protein